MSEKTITVLVLLLAFLILERMFPASRVRDNIARLFKNFSLASLNALIAPFIVLPITQFAAGHAMGLRPQWWNLALDLLVLDAWIYAWHRLNHALPFLWRFHEVHHLDEQLDTSTGLRFHFGEVALSSVVRAAVIYLLSVPFLNVLMFETLVAAAAMFQHSNVKLPEKLEAALSKIVVTPGLHWVHHHARREDTDSNFSLGLSIWDVMFGSRSLNHRTFGMPLGVEGGKDESLLRLIFRPFWRR